MKKYTSTFDAKENKQDIQIDDIFADFLKEKTINETLKPKTLEHHEENYKYFKKFLNTKGIKYLKDVNRDVIVDYYAFMKSKSLASQTCIIRLRSIRTLFKYYTEKGYIDNDKYQYLFKNFELKQQRSKQRYLCIWQVKNALNGN